MGQRLNFQPSRKTLRKGDLQIKYAKKRREDDPRTGRGDLSVLGEDVFFRGGRRNRITKKQVTAFKKTRGEK